MLVSVYRYNPETDREPYMQDVEVAHDLIDPPITAGEDLREAHQLALVRLGGGRRLAISRAVVVRAPRRESEGARVERLAEQRRRRAPRIDAHRAYSTS